MSLFILILRNLKYYRKAYLAILIGTLISTAVLTGALVVGDSVRYSLEQLTDIRLGKTRFAIQSGDRYFRQHIANQLAQQVKSPVVPVLQLEGIALNPDKNTQINRVVVLGVDERFKTIWNSSVKSPRTDEAIISRNTAEKLNLKAGDEFLLKIRKQAKASENAPFVSEKEPKVVFRLTIIAVAEDEQMGRFSLNNIQSAPYNIFISLPMMAAKIGIKESANMMLIVNNENEDLNKQKLDSLVRLCWQPEDAGLEFRNLSENTKYEIRSDRIFIDDYTAKAIQKSMPGAEPIFTYLVNAISTKRKSTPYSFVTAADPGYLNWRLSDHEIIISNWLASDLDINTGDTLTLRYFIMGPFRRLTEDSARFCIKLILPITDPRFDRTLMPDFPGLSDAGNCRDWETGAPVDLHKIRDKDEQYWNDYRGTPKAFISFAAGKKLWDNAFGHATAYRFSTDTAGLKIIKNTLMRRLDPAENGLSVQGIYSEGKSSAANSTDFGGLFLSLSFFIIIAALLLTALLFSLLAQKRMAETAIMAALGFRKKEIIRILFIEAALVVIAGSFLGVVTGILYNKLLLLGLNTLWQDAIRTSMLQMHLVPATLLTGFVSGIMTAFLVLVFVLLRNLRKPLSIIVRGVKLTLPSLNSRWKNINLSVALFCFFSAVSIQAYSIFSGQTGISLSFLLVGGIILAGGIVFLNFMLLHANRKTNDPLPGFFTMILRNVSLKRRRTITAVALLAIGIFSVIITGANHKTFYGTEKSRQSGTGGFLFWVETTVPVLYDLNSPEGKEKYGLADEKAFQNVQFLQMIRLNGNDASCLNLNQVAQPPILGINATYFDHKQTFSFLKLEPTISMQHPWLGLNTALAPGIIPGFADQTVIQWGLRKKVGDTLLYKDENGKTLKVKIMGGLENSVFQGNVLVSAALFRQFFPSSGGFKVMLIDGEYSNRSAISKRLEYLLQDYGVEIMLASERLAQFNSVENTYLSVFMLLGGLAIIIGTIGLGIVLLQNLAERKQEIALYQALGFKHNYILKLLFSENLFILLAGISVGLFAAFAGLLPSFFSLSFQFPATFILVILLLTFLNGVLWIYFSLKSALRKNLIQALRVE